MMQASAIEEKKMECKRIRIRIVRHSTSIYNAAKMKETKENPVNIFDSMYINSELSTDGIKLCRKIRSQEDGFNPTTVFSTPLLRGLQTSYYLYAKTVEAISGNTSDSDTAEEEMQAETEISQSIPCIVHPLLTEKEWGACDIPSETSAHCKEYAKKMAKSGVLKLDYSHLNTENPDLYFLDYIDCPDHEAIKKLIAEAAEKRSSHVEVSCAMQKEVATKNPKLANGCITTFESDESVKARAKKFGEFLVELNKKEQLNGDIAIVTSREFMKRFCEVWKIPTPTDFKNCDSVDFTLSELSN